MRSFASVLMDHLKPVGPAAGHRALVDMTADTLQDIHQNLTVVRREIDYVLVALEAASKPTFGKDKDAVEITELQVREAITAVRRFADSARASGSAQSDLSGATERAGVIGGLLRVGLLQTRRTDVSA